MKDLDVTKIGFKLELDSQQKADFISQIKNESQFFYENGINDYSLLIGVHEVRKHDIVNYYSRINDFRPNANLKYEDIVEKVIKEHPVYSQIKFIPSFNNSEQECFQKTTNTFTS